MAHISYYDFHASNPNGNLKYAILDTAGDWTVTTLVTTGDVGLFSSLALHNEFVYITYYDSDHTEIKQISNETGRWVSKVLIEKVGSATSCPLVIENNGTKHVSYFKNCGGDFRIDLCYGTIGTNHFIDILVDDSGVGNGVQVSLTLDEDGKAYISYYDATDKDLKSAYQTAP